MKVFISGPMSGYEDYNTPAFNKAEARLKEAGFDVFNPAWMKVGSEWTSKELLSIDIHALSFCDAIYHLPEWDNASGAVIEHAYAMKSGMPILAEIKLYEKEESPIHPTFHYDKMLIEIPRKFTTFEILEDYLKGEYPDYTIHGGHRTISSGLHFVKWAPFPLKKIEGTIRRNGYNEFDLTKIEDGDETYILLYPV